MSGINEDLWEFPTDHNFKVMGPAHHPLTEIVIDVVRKHAPNFDETRISIKASRTGKYNSVTAIVWVENKEQLENIYRDLSARDEVSWTL